MEQHRLHQHLALFPFLVYAEGGGVHFNHLFIFIIIYYYFIFFIKDKISTLA